MIKRQRENTAKYLYDISKGVVLLSVVGNLIKEEWDIPVIIIGLAVTFMFFLWAYIIDGGDKNE